MAHRHRGHRRPVAATSGCRGGDAGARGHAGAASHRVIRRRGVHVLPVPSEGGEPSGSRSRARRPGGSLRAALRPVHPPARRSGDRGARAERARFGRVGTALHVTRRSPLATELRARPELAARLVGGARRRCVPCRRHRCVVRRLHDAGGTRVLPRAVGGGHRDRRHQQPRDVPREHRHRTGADSARWSTASSTPTAISSSKRRRSRASTTCVRRSCWCTAQMIRECPSARHASCMPCCERAVSSASC